MVPDELIPINIKISFDQISKDDVLSRTSVVAVGGTFNLRIPTTTMTDA